MVHKRKNEEKEIVTFAVFRKGETKKIIGFFDPEARKIFKLDKPISEKVWMKRTGAKKIGKLTELKDVR